MVSGEHSKEMAENRRVHPGCVNASNPYHQCGMECLEKIAQGQGHKDKKKLASSWSFGGKKKGIAETEPNSPQPMSPRVANSPQPMPSRVANSPQPMSSQVLDNAPIVNYHHDARHPRSEAYSKKKAESEIVECFSSSKQLSGEIYPHDQSFGKDRAPSTQLMPGTRNVMKADRPEDRPEGSKDPTKHMVTSPLGATLTKHGKEADASQAAPEDSDDEEAENSDSCVTIGKYQVKARISSILQAIFDKYGDIAANCRLESFSMRSYYLECLCSVVQELQSTSLMQMTKAKVKEMLAIIKDVESSQIRVDWLRDILSEVSENIDVVTQHETISAAKVNCDILLESTRKELESQMKDLALREKELADARARVAVTRASLSKLESESSQLNKAIESMKLMVKKLKSKSLVHEILQ